jgi:5-formyltetrahydrofolate cyclo-ligase
MTKQEIRKIYLQKRADLSDAEYHLLNRQLCDSFFAHINLSAISVLHTFLPIQKTREVNTWLIIDRLQREYPDTRISVPKINKESGLLDNFYFQEKDQMEINTWGIPEPMYGIPTPTESIDAVLVPLLAFDTKGNRVGYGRGFYDKFLATCREDCQKIGVSFFEQAEKITGIHKTDVPLDLIITPKNGILV